MPLRSSAVRLPSRERLVERTTRPLRAVWASERTELRLPRLGRLGREPWLVLAPIVLLQWLCVPLFWLAVQHNGALFYHGGDETWYYTTAWLLAHGHLPETAVGYGWSLVLAPLTWFTGPNFLAGLPVLIAVEVLVLLPLGTVLIYLCAARIGGRIVGYLSALVWALSPVATIPLFSHDYHDRWVGQFLPQTFGLTGLSEFPSTLSVLVAAYFVLRALDTRDDVDAILAGVAAGFAVGVKPSNLLFLGAPFVAFLLARRWRTIVVFGIALAPALITLALWKARGLGNIPAVAEPVHRLAFGAGDTLAKLSPSTDARGIAKYLHFDYGQLRHNYQGIQEFFWSARFLQWVPLAGAVAVARRSVPKAGFLLAWFGAYLVVKGSSQVASVDNGTFWRFLMPAFPAYCMLAGSIPLLFPQYGIRLAERFPAGLRTIRRRRVAVAVPVLLFAVVPLLVAATFQTRTPPLAAKFFAENLYLPLDQGPKLSVSRDASGAEVLHWTAPTHGSTKVFFRLFRSKTTQLYQPDLPPGHEGVRCLPKSFGPNDCRIEMDLVGTTRDHSYRDVPKPGRWTYRVGMSANWLNSIYYGDNLMLSQPVDVTFP